MAINNWTSHRLLISFVVFLCVSFIVVPYTMDAHLPLLVNVLLWPLYLLAPVIGRMLPRGNMGTAEHPSYEGTPLDVFAGFALVGISILFYPVATFVILSVIARIQARRNRE